MTRLRPGARLGGRYEIVDTAPIEPEITAAQPIYNCNGCEVDLAGKTDQLNKNQGNREYAAGVALPLWLPGERSRQGALADAESKAVDSRVTAAQLRTAAAVRAEELPEDAEPNQADGSLAA
mgnify:CR=1 FL=1